MVHTENHQDTGFAKLSELAYETTGLVLSPSKADMIQSRLRHRLKLLSFSNLEDYCEFVTSPEGAAEQQEMVSALTTNVSGFFREPHHFAYLVEQQLGPIIQQAKSGQSVRIWSAGCSKGQEPYSIAMSLLKAWPEIQSYDVKILATDIDYTVVAHAKAGRYSEDQISGLPEEYRAQFVENEHQDDELKYRISDQVQALISFKSLNLMEKWPMKRPFEAIFCRNVVIYFDADFQAKLWPRFSDQLSPTGTIYVGHSERISSPLFQSVGPTTYRKSGQSA